MPSQYIDKINLPGNREYDMRDTVQELKDVSLSNLASGQALVYNGSSWVNQVISSGSTPNDATITIQKNGTSIDSFTLNQATNKSINIQVAELPVVASSDNGKILQVVNGAWSTVTPVTVYSGNAAPNNSLGIDGDIYLQSE